MDSAAVNPTRPSPSDATATAVRSTPVGSIRDRQREECIQVSASIESPGRYQTYRVARAGDLDCIGGANQGTKVSRILRAALVVPGVASGFCR